MIFLKKIILSLLLVLVLASCGRFTVISELKQDYHYISDSDNHQIDLYFNQNNTYSLSVDGKYEYLEKKYSVKSSRKEVYDTSFGIDKKRTIYIIELKDACYTDSIGNQECFFVVAIKYQNTTVVYLKMKQPLEGEEEIGAIKLKVSKE